MNKPPKKDKKEDFQFKAYLLLYRALKKLYTFKVQKVVRKLKKDNQRKLEFENEGQDQAAIDKIQTEIERLIKQKGKLDLVTKDSLKMLTIYNLNQVYSISLEKHKEIFEKELPGFIEKIELFNDEGNEEIQRIKWFEETIKDHKVYAEVKQKLEALVATMEQIMEKNKTRRKTRKQNKKARMMQKSEGSVDSSQHKNGMEIEGEQEGDEGEDIVLGAIPGATADDDEDDGQDIVIEDDDEEETKPKKNAPKKQEGKNRQSERYKKFQEKKKRQDGSRNRDQGGDKVFGNQRNEGRGRDNNNFRGDRGDRSFTNDRQQSRGPRQGYGQGGQGQQDGGNRGFGGRDNRGNGERGPRRDQKDFSRGRREEFGEKRRGPNQDFSEEKIQKKVFGEERGGRGFRDNKAGKDDNDIEKFKPFDQLHPSWKANIEQKQKATIAAFQGTKEKL